MLALVWFHRRTSQRGNEYLRCKFQVAAGPSKGKSFFCPWSLGTQNPGSRQRWEIWMEQVGCDDEIDLDDDAAIRAAFLGKPFKAEVSLRTRNGYEENDLRRLIYPRLYGEIDRADIEAWNTEWAARDWSQSDPGEDPGPTGDDRPPPPSSEPQWSKGSGFGDDDGDDVPF
jgi:hypothetical protein